MNVYFVQCILHLLDKLKILAVIVIIFNSEINLNSFICLVIFRRFFKLLQWPLQLFYKNASLLNKILRNKSFVSKKFTSAM